MRKERILAVIMSVLLALSILPMTVFAAETTVLDGKLKIHGIVAEGKTLSADFKEVNIFLRGLIPLVGFNSTSVYYERHERIAGESHYPLKKMLALAFDGITSLSIKPIRMITAAGTIISCLGFCAIIWAIIMQVMGNTVAGWASMVCIVAFLGGIQLLSLGVIGEYIGKIYLETKARPRYIISETTDDVQD